MIRMELIRRNVRRSCARQSTTWAWARPRGHSGSSTTSPPSLTPTRSSSATTRTATGLSSSTRSCSGRCASSGSGLWTGCSPCTRASSRPTSCSSSSLTTSRFFRNFPKFIRIQFLSNIFLRDWNKFGSGSNNVSCMFSIEDKSINDVIIFYCGDEIHLKLHCQIQI